MRATVAATMIGELYRKPPIINPAGQRRTTDEYSGGAARGLTVSIYLLEQDKDDTLETSKGTDQLEVLDAHSAVWNYTSEQRNLKFHHQYPKVGPCNH